MHPTIATIDIGTNSVLLLIVRPRADGTLEVLADEAHITRIGEGIGTGHEFLPAAMERTLRVLGGYAARCRELGATQILAVGTAAFRRITNARAFIDQARGTCGFTIDVIAGEREAELSYLAASHDFGDDCLVCDIGGGSTEFIWRTAPHQPITAISIPLGSVALHEQYCHSDPIDGVDYDRTRRAISAAMQQHLVHSTTPGLFLSRDRAYRQAGRRPPHLVALAGSATTLAAMQLRLSTYNHWEVHGKVLTLQEIIALQDAMRTRTVAQRTLLPGLEPARADVILAGTLILTETMQSLGYVRVTISDRGVRWGLVYERMAKIPY